MGSKDNPTVSDVFEEGEHVSVEGAGEQTPTIDSEVAGRLRSRAGAWRAVGASPTVMRWIEMGYDLPLMGTPPAFFASNHAGATQYDFFIDESLPKWLKAGAVRRASCQPHMVSPLDVVPKKQEGKYRLILDLRELNKYVRDFPFVMETLLRRRYGFLPGDWMFSIDLESGYYHVEVREEDRKYLGFAWRGEWFEFCVLPFGLKSAPAAFTKVMSQLARYWRSCGIRLLFYLDDWAFMSSSKESAEQLVHQIIGDMVRLGLLINAGKSVLRPSTRLTLLGFIVDTVEGTFRITPERKVSMEHSLDCALAQSWLPVRELASVAGKLVSCYLALGPVTRIFTRSLFECLAARDVTLTARSARGRARQWWRGGVRLSRKAQSELKFWKRTLPKWDGCSVWPPTCLRPLRLYVDASDGAWGAFEEGNESTAMRELFSPKHAQQSSTHRETRALLRLLQLRAESFRSQTVLVHTDNKGVPGVIHHGSPVANLNRLAKRVSILCAQFGIRLWLRWIPRELNQDADDLSKYKCSSDWSLSRALFNNLDCKWGPHTVDRMASETNTKLPRFNSKWLCRGTEAVDCFTQNWQHDNNWVCTDFHQVERVIAHMRGCKASGTLVIPCWRWQPWWGQLFEAGQPTACVQDWMVLPRHSSAFVAEHSASLLGLAEHDFDVLAVRVSFAA